MKSKAYVVIHHSKALPSSIVRGSFSQSFITGIRRNLRLKKPAFNEHFPLIFACYFEEIMITAQRPLKWKLMTKHLQPK